MSIETNERGGGKPGGNLRTLGSDSVRLTPGQLGGRRVRRIFCVGRVERVEIGRAGVVVRYWGRKLWRGIVVETGEDLFVQILQVYIDRRFLGGHGCVRESLRCRLNVRE